MKLVKFQDPIFATVQGEGVLTGMPSVFVRTHGCNFDCEWCDTKESWRPGSSYHEMSVEEIVAKVRAFRIKHVVITGGNPALQGAEVNQFIRELGPHYHYTMETQGEPWHPVMQQMDLLSLSPKIGKDFDTRCVMYEHQPKSQIQFKIVVCDVADVKTALSTLDALTSLAFNAGYGEDEIHAIIQPEYSKGRRWVTDVTRIVLDLDNEMYNTRVRVMPQFHKSVYGVA